VLSRPAVHHKRVRVIRLTADGVRLRRRLVEGMSQKPAIHALPVKHQEQLLEILREIA